MSNLIRQTHSDKLIPPRLDDYVRFSWYCQYADETTVLEGNIKEITTDNFGTPCITIEVITQVPHRDPHNVYWQRGVYTVGDPDEDVTLIKRPFKIDDPVEYFDSGETNAWHDMIFNEYDAQQNECELSFYRHADPLLRDAVVCHICKSVTGFPTSSTLFCSACRVDTKR